MADILHRQTADRPWFGRDEAGSRHRGDAVRVVCALQIGADVSVIHALQKTSKSGIATPRQKIDLVRKRLKRLKEIAR
jgi:phage-related protein